MVRSKAVLVYTSKRGNKHGQSQQFQINTPRIVFGAQSQDGVPVGADATSSSSSTLCVTVCACEPCVFIAAIHPSPSSLASLSSLPSPPSPPCSTDCPPGPEHGHRHRQHRHGHGHGGHRHEHAETPVEADCCRWLNSVDNECVCDLLVYLPPFLSKPIHQYTVTVDSSCNVTFQCGSRLRV
ncbi:hypothetical protein RJ640_019794 [Escallonia rubra]|uniref:Uncharacterized protein n=1 Tax=Escallonia rubra TaxID=112253 RepID=A0AA88RIS8_9ASTE|nr:hypothetical protein RJ640_019794 [Escallonia rubra]